MLHQAATGSISTLQRERSSEALARDQVHENKACQSRNDDDYMRDKERTNTKKRSRRVRPLSRTELVQCGEHG